MESQNLAEIVERDDRFLRREVFPLPSPKLGTFTPPYIVDFALDFINSLQGPCGNGEKCRALVQEEFAEKIHLVSAKKRFLKYEDALGIPHRLTVIDDSDNYLIKLQDFVSNFLSSLGWDGSIKYNCPNCKESRNFSYLGLSNLGGERNHLYNCPSCHDTFSRATLELSSGENVSLERAVAG
jgi:hypothetical protein